MASDRITVPAVPVRLAGLVGAGGLVRPWVNVHLGDGGIDFRTAHNARWQTAWAQRRCQTCGGRLTVPSVLFGGPSQLRRLLFDEPALHPECAVYASRACPMLAGWLSHYADREHLADGPRGKNCPVPGCDCAGWTPTRGSTAHPGSAAHPWYAVYVTGYDLAVDPDQRIIGGAVRREAVARVVLVSEPGAGRCWTVIPDPPIGALVAAEEHGSGR